MLAAGCPTKINDPRKKMDNSENGKSEQSQKPEGRGKLWQSLGKSMPIAWVVIAVLLFAVLTTWLRLRELGQ